MEYYFLSLLDFKEIACLFVFLISWASFECFFFYIVYHRWNCCCCCFVFCFCFCLFFLTGVKCSVPSLFSFFIFFIFSFCVCFLKWQPTVDASIPWFWSPCHQPVITRQNEHIDNVNILFDKETNGSVCLPSGDQFLHGAVLTKTESESV